MLYLFFNMTWLRHLSVFADILLPNDTQHKPTVVVAGYGWGAHAFIKNISHRDFNVQVISERDKRLNQNRMISNLTPSYTPAVVGVIQDTCLTVDKNSKIVKGKAANYPYDYLVVATGSEVHDFGIQGVKEYCKMCKTDKDIVAIRESAKEAAIILGAGPTGLELACSLHRRGMTDIRVIEAAKSILPGFSDAFRSYVETALKTKGIQLNMNHVIKQVSENGIQTQHGILPYTGRDLVVWTCGVRPVEFVRTLEPRGLLVDDQLHYASDIFVLGDACKNKGPPTAQNARQQGNYLAELFNSRFTKKTPYTFNEIGRCLDLGDGLLFELYGLLFFVPHLDWQELSWVASV